VSWRRSNPLHNGGSLPTNAVSSRARTRERANGSCGQPKPLDRTSNGPARPQKGFLIPSFKTRIAAATIAAALAPICILAAPSLAQATPTGIDFAANASGSAIPAGWATNQFYYANPSGGNLTVSYTGASAGDTVDLYDYQPGSPVELGSASTAGSNGSGSFTFASSSVNDGDLIGLSDSTAVTLNE
jgi:hypothetical protein